MEASLVIILCVAVLLTVIILKLTHLNSSKEVLDGPILSYEYKNAGIVVDTVKSKVRLFNEYNDKIYSFEQISNINYFTIEIPEINTSPILMFIRSKFNVGKKPLTSLHYVLRITVNNDEIKKFEIKLPKDNEIIPSICICEYWISVFEKYVIQLDHKAAK
ncbi:hypothetical protein NGK11_03195 [Raoultella ornithinolytica]|uniref:hypothetical protein n=1 Tax=Raoultella ornithinolytica TaxID=54291 RepID=UPI002DBBE8E0|nr:hypothetical protein [Raoultella ornithinolytica]MEB8015436.1 hypothetical protein [Raoultella ornithinolytica]